MLYKQRTRKIFLTFVLFSILLVTSFVSIDTLFFFNKTKEVTINNAISKNKEREEVIKKFILNSKDILKALRNSKEFKKYLLSKSKENEQELESLFLTFARSQGSFMQLRYIDKSGMEKVRVDRESENDLALLVPKIDFKIKKTDIILKSL